MEHSIEPSIQTVQRMGQLLSVEQIQTSGCFGFLSIFSKEEDDFCVSPIFTKMLTETFNYWDWPVHDP